MPELAPLIGQGDYIEVKGKIFVVINDQDFSLEGAGMLYAFPEYVKAYEVFKMKPRIGGGYGERYDKRQVQGYWSWRKQTKMDAEGDLRTPDHQATFWVQARPQDGNGFIKCLMQVVAGPTDQQVANPKVDEAIVNDY